MAYRKQEGGQNHPPPMKTKITATLVLALGFISTGAFAENATVPPLPAANAIATPAPAPDRVASVAQSSGTGGSARVVTSPGLTAKQIAQLEHDVDAKYRPDEGLEQNFAEQVLRGARVNLSQAESPAVVFSEPPSPAFSYDSHAPAYWYPSVSFHFDWGRNRRS
jgi:hypothetical protein